MDFVLLHGWGFKPCVWSPVAERLLTSGCRVHLPALPGHCSAPHGYLLADVQRTAEYLAESVPRQFVRPIWVGWSLGGLVALAAASLPHVLAGGVVLVGMTPRFLAAPDWPIGLAGHLLDRFQEDLVEDRSGLESRFLALCVHNARNPGRLRRDVRPCFGMDSMASRDLQAGLNALSSSDLRALWGGLRLPAACWLGSDDALIPLATASFDAAQGTDSAVGRLAALQRLRPDAELVVEPGGHLAWFENPADFANFLQGFSGCLK
jgi:pimeloyl-[acyl-carrier protein] methyl ester esterase